jgi:ADP-heptose:LPS heptosyltransferase
MSSPRKLILENHQAPGDTLMLTAAVRDLHLCHLGKFITDVRTPSPDLWRHNPYLTPLSEDDPGVERLVCHYPLVHRCNELPVHFLHGFTAYLSEQLGVPITPQAFRGDVHLSAEEKAEEPLVHRLTGDTSPYWIIVAGGKFDFTAKWWATERYQAVVDHFAGRLRFVQDGLLEHHHPPLSGVLDLRGKTSLRELVKLMYHAAGVICPVTMHMHLCAAVETPRGFPPLRPCVVVAGGREPPQWEAYPGHRFLHTIGMLRCCQNGGCWRSRVKPIGDGDRKDQPGSLCVDVAGDLPRCMDMISAEDVIREVERFAGYWRWEGEMTKNELARRGLNTET